MQVQYMVNFDKSPLPTTLTNELWQLNTHKYVHMQTYYRLQYKASTKLQLTIIKYNNRCGTHEFTCCKTEPQIFYPRNLIHLWYIATVLINNWVAIVFCIGQCNCCVEYVPLPFLRNLTYMQSLLKVLLYSSHPLCNTFYYTKCFWISHTTVQVQYLTMPGETEDMGNK